MKVNGVENYNNPGRCPMHGTALEVDRNHGELELTYHCPTCYENERVKRREFIFGDSPDAGHVGLAGKVARGITDALAYLEECGQPGKVASLRSWEAVGIAKLVKDLQAANVALSSRLAEAEAVIDAFWTSQADRMAQEYRERYPKGENL